MIAGILRPTSGSGRSSAAWTCQARPLEAKARLGYIPDRPFVYDKLTGGEFLRFAAALYGQQGPAVERRIDELLELFELTPWKDELTEIVQPRHAAEADHLGRAGAPPGGHRGGRADGGARSPRAPGCSRISSASSWTAAGRCS